MKNSRSSCPINLSLEVFGDKWTLIILRDIMMTGKRHFRELLQSDEKIASNVLMNRLNRLEAMGILTKAKDESHKQKILYSLTQQGIDLFPVFMSIGVWAKKYLPVGKEQTKHLNWLLEGGAQRQGEFIERLKEEHLKP